MMTTRSAFPTLDRAFDAAIRSSLRGGGERSTFPIAADVRETSDGYGFQLDVPGVKLENLEITLANRVLTVRGARHFEAGQDDKVARGRPYGEFAVSYALPDSVQEEGLTADLAEGVLSIRVPKQPKAQPRKIPIVSGAHPKNLTE